MVKVLLTGAAGTIGSCLRRDLGNAFDFRSFDRVPVDDSEDVILGDVTDEQAVRSAVRNVEAVVHLAANPAIEQPWEDVVSVGIQGTRNVFEAARCEGIERVVFASTAFVTGWKELRRGSRITVDTPAYPTTNYGLGKLFGEQMARLYSEQHNMSIVCLRIGDFHDRLSWQIEPTDPVRRTLCSARDLAQLVRLSLESQALGFSVFFGVSNNRCNLWDISNARRLLGYKPKDDAERNVARQPPWKALFGSMLRTKKG